MDMTSSLSPNRRVLSDTFVDTPSILLWKVSKVLVLLLSDRIENLTFNGTSGGPFFEYFGFGL